MLLIREKLLNANDRPAGSVIVPRSTKNPLFEETSERAIRAAHRRKWTLVGTVIAGISLVVAVMFYAQIDSKSERKIVTEYLAIDATYSAELEKFQAEMQAAGAKATPDMAPDHSGSSQKFAEFAKKYPADPLAWQAALKAATSNIEAKKFDDAAGLLEPLAARTLQNDIIQTRVRRTLAGIYAQKGNYDKALSELNLIEKLANNPVPGETRLFKAQVLFQAGKKEEAGKLLRELQQGGSSEGDFRGRSVSTEAGLWLGYWQL